MAHFIMQVENLRKVYDKKLILDDISLSFYYGAKIGVLGSNGSGKSTLLRIMAGVDKDFDGRLYQQPGIKIGHVPQEPLLDTEKTVRGIVEEGVAETVALLKAFEEVSSNCDTDEAIERMGALQEKIDQLGAWELDRHLEIAADALERL